MSVASYGRLKSKKRNNQWMNLISFVVVIFLLYSCSFQSGGYFARRSCRMPRYTNIRLHCCQEIGCFQTMQKR